MHAEQDVVDRNVIGVVAVQKHQQLVLNRQLGVHEPNTINLFHERAHRSLHELDDSPPPPPWCGASPRGARRSALAPGGPAHRRGAEWGRSMFVAFTIRANEGRHLIRPISARYMHAKEARAYEAQGSEAQE
jgi:hypothetical protein